MRRRIRGEERGTTARFGTTVLVALLASALVFLWLAWATSDGSGRVERFERWTSGPNRLTDPGTGITFPVGPVPSRLLHQVADPAPVYALFTSEIYVRNPLPPEAGLLYGPRPDRGALRVYDFSSRLGRTGWNRVAVSADDALGLADARTVGLSLASLSGPNVMGVRGAALRTVSFPRRLRQMGAALLRHEPLAAHSINFIPSQKVAGRGFTFILWCALLLAVLVLLARRFVLRQRFPLALHIAATVLALFVLGDLRNSVDDLANAREALSRRARAQAVDPGVAELEAYFPWFHDTLNYVRAWRRRAPEKRYYLRIAGSPFANRALGRAEYLLLPARRAADLEEADLVLVYGYPSRPFDASPAWKRVDALPSGVLVYARRFEKRR